MARRSVNASRRDSKAVPVTEVSAIDDPGDSRQHKNDPQGMDEDCFGDFLANLPVHLYIKDADGRYIYSNAGPQLGVGITGHDLVGKTDPEVYPPDLAEEYRRYDQLVLKSGKKLELIERIEGKDGVYSFLTTKFPLCQNGRPKLIGCFSLDLTQRLQTEERLRASESEYREIVHTANSIIVRFDREGRITFINDYGLKFFGYDEKSLLGRHVVGTIVPAVESSGRDLRSFVSDILANPERYALNANENMRSNGERVWVAWTNKAITDMSGRVIEVLAIGNDITYHKQSEQQLQYLAYHDELTGLPNRKSFFEKLDDILIQSERNDPAKWALLFLDLDRFKEINDVLGHDIGDELLKHVSRRIKVWVRKSDYVFRLGGDEFTVIATNLHREEEAALIAQKLTDALSLPYIIQGNEIHSTVSIGISIYPDDGDNGRALVKNADIAMYAAKQSQTCYHFYSAEMNQKAVVKLRLKRDLRHAVQRDQLVLYYQPIIRDQNRLVGLEALLRWEHPELGILSPDEFLPLAEETGYIVDFSKWVLEKACRTVKRFHELGHDWLHVAVNLSGSQFKAPGLVESVYSVLKETGLPPGHLVLELTETGVMEGAEDVVEKMALLHRSGVRFAIDDFGTGYSSLVQLKRFPVDTLKIDRSFVSGLASSQEDRIIVKTILSMARNLSLEPIAEGVETREQIDFLVKHGCRLMQGYYFGRPVPEDEFEARLINEGMK